MNKKNANHILCMFIMCMIALFMITGCDACKGCGKACSGTCINGCSAGCLGCAGLCNSCINSSFCEGCVEGMEDYNEKH